MVFFPKKQVSSEIKYWWLNLIVGAILILVGLIIFSTPEACYFSLSALFAVVITLIGISQIYFSCKNKANLTSWSWYFTSGILDLLIGILFFWIPLFSLDIFPSLVAIWFVCKSIYGISLSIELKEYGVKAWGILLFTSLCVAILSIILIAYPAFRLINTITNTSTSFIMLGILMIIGAFSVKNLHKVPLKIINSYTSSL